MCASYMSSSTAKTQAWSEHDLAGGTGTGQRAGIASTKLNVHIVCTSRAQQTSPRNWMQAQPQQLEHRDQAFKA